MEDCPGNGNNTAELYSSFFYNIPTSMSYFHDTTPKQWSFSDAFQCCQKKKPNTSQRVILSQIKTGLERLQDRTDKVGATAKKVLEKSDKDGQEVATHV
jgi:hypothetical protein